MTAQDDPHFDTDATLGRIRRHLANKGVDVLVAMILDLAERDEALFRRLELAAAATQSDPRLLEARLTKALDRALYIPDYVDYRGAPDWAGGVDDVLDTLAGLASGAEAALVLDLAERALDGIEAAMQSIDDSSGHCGGLLERAAEIHLAAARAAKPEPMALARGLFDREVAGDYDTFYGAARTYAEVLGAAGLAEYRRLATEAWDELPARQGRSGQPAPSGNYLALKTILDFFAERDGDVEARIALRSKDLSSPWLYLQLAEFCLAQGRGAEALRRAEDGLFVFEDGRPDERLLFFAVDLLVEAGRDGDAMVHLWRGFAAVPSLALYARLRKHGGAAAAEQAIERLRARAASEQQARWHYPADLLIEILMQEGQFDAAWGAVQAHGASIGLRETLARTSEATHPREALAVYAERVDALAEGGGNPAYAAAAALIARMAGLRDGAEQAAYVHLVKARFGRKRNFMALLR